MLDDPNLAVLGQFTPEGRLKPGYSQHYLFLVGRDDCHGIIHYLLTHEDFLLKFNMFGYDDDELNQDILDLFKKTNVRVQASLDRSQSGGVHEKKIIAFDEQTDSVAFNNSFCIVESATHQISHTKGGVCVGLGISWEGSMNWSESGEGAGISLKADVKNPAGYKAQNNTLLVSTNPVFLTRFSAQLDAEHTIGLRQHYGT